MKHRGGVIIILLLAVAGILSFVGSASACGNANNTITVGPFNNPRYPSPPEPGDHMHTLISHSDTAGCSGSFYGGGGDGGSDWTDDEFWTWWSGGSGDHCGSYHIQSGWVDAGDGNLYSGAGFDVSYGSNCVVCVPGTGGACTSAANICGMTNSGTLQCDGSCNATRPADALCNANPVTSHDDATCNATWGWAYDPDYAGSIDVHIYRDGNAGAGGVFMGAVTANQSSLDIVPWHPGRSSARWTWPIPQSMKDGYTHSIVAYAINVNAAGTQSGVNPFLSGTPKSITCNNPPAGTFTAATCGTATGNATDAEGPTVPIAIYDGAAGAGTLLANGNATPNFNIPFTPFTNGLTHNIYAYAKDVPGGALAPLGTPIPVTCAPTVTLSAAPSPVQFGEKATVTWSVTNATSCVASPAGWYNPATLVNGVANGSGLSAALYAPTTFTLTCQNAAGTTTIGTANSAVNVPPPTGTITNVTDSNFCTGGAGMIIDWKYDSIAAPISAYRVEVLDGSNTVVFDTGKATKTTAVESPTVPLASMQQPTFWARMSTALISGVVKLFSR
jgi:hypothetical protein